jgi:hypothetical protein
MRYGCRIGVLGKVGFTGWLPKNILQLFFGFVKEYLIYFLLDKPDIGCILDV